MTPPPSPSANGSGRILVGVLVCVLLLLSSLPGLFQAAEGLSGRETLVSGPVGTFTPVDRSCNNGGCALVGTFTSGDGSIIRQDVVLSRDAVRLSRSDPMPTAIGDVRLGPSGFFRTFAYTTDYSWQWAVTKGVLIAVLVPVALLGVIVGIRRRRARRRP
ncbi:hypothetical protein [Nocardiopsis lucentensis]|nr:hypothetical protein [Nocardiopsis lucentensis]